MLRLADMTTGDTQELASPYTTVFSTGGSASGWVDGLVLSPDGKSVAIFETSGGIKPDPDTGTIDMDAARLGRKLVSLALSGIPKTASSRLQAAMR